MKRLTRVRITPGMSMAVAMVALLAAIGGTSYAASKIDGGQIQSSSITAKQIKNDSLKGKDFKSGGLTGTDLRDDKVTGKQVNESKLQGLTTRWLLLNEQGGIEEQSGGFTVIDAYATNDNVYIDAGQSMVAHGITATVALQNKLDLDGMPGADPSANGQVSVARCQTAAVECAPAGAKNENAFVVSPRQDDGTATGPNSRERVYVQITE